MLCSGIERKFGIRAEDLPEDTWHTVVADTVETHIQLINRLASQGFVPESLYLCGSVALKSPYVIPGLRDGRQQQRDRLNHLPRVKRATHGEDGGLVGAGDAAHEIAPQQ